MGKCKKVISGLIVSLMVVSGCSGYTSAALYYQSMRTAKVASPLKITQQKAVAILQDYLLKKGIISKVDKKLVMVYDHMDTAKGKSYYVIHVYDNMTDHTATIGWYGVSVYGDSIYDFLFFKELVQLKAPGSSTQKPAAPQKITSKKAEELIRSFLLSKRIISRNDKRLVVMYDHMDTAEGKSYYVIHVYDNMVDHTATIGWYGIDLYGNSIYDFLMYKKLR